MLSLVARSSACRWGSVVGRPRLLHQIAGRTPSPAANLSIASAESGHDGIRVTWERGDSTRFDSQHLLDHCRCANCFHPVTKQRLKTLSQFPENPTCEAVNVVDNAIQVDWSAGHRSIFPAIFLANAAYDPPIENRLPEERTLWNAKISKSPPTVTFEAYNNDAGLKQTLDLTHEFGFCLVAGLPPTAESTEAAIQRIGRIRETHYGGFWDFTSDMSHGDLAYSSEALPAHTDTTYFTDPAGLQIFHLLSHQGEGGTTLLVDGFYAASLLKELHPDSYEVLSTTPIPCHASGTVGTMLRPIRSSPVFTHDGENLVQVRWNNEDRGVLTGLSSSQLRAWYKAARRYEELLKSDSELWLQLRPGTLLIIDNWRVMHGRSSFTGARRMCGAYIGADEWRSARAVMEQDNDLWAAGW